MTTAQFSPTVELHYTCIGTGADVLLVHGWASSGRMWLELMRTLGHQYRFWAVDLCGFGESSLPDGDCTLDMEMHTATLVQFCRAHDIHPHAIIGHSMGGLLALKLAAEHPDLAERLVLMSPVVTGRMGKWLDFNRVITSDFGRFAMTRSKQLGTFIQSGLFDIFTPLIYGTKSGRPTSWGRAFLEASPAFVPRGRRVQLILDALDGPESLAETASAATPSWGLQVFGGAAVFADPALAETFRASVERIRAACEGAAP